MKNNINYKEIMGNKNVNFYTENNVNEEVIKAFSEIMETFFKKDIRRKIKEKSKKTISLAKNHTNDELAEAIQNALKQSFAEDTRRKINWEAREKRAKVFHIENPLALQ